MNITRRDINFAINLLEKLEYGNGKVAAATVVTSTVRQFVKHKIVSARYKSNRPKMTYDELELCLNDKKLYAIKSVKSRLDMSLLDAKRYVEKHAATELAKADTKRTNKFKPSSGW